MYHSLCLMMRDKGLRLRHSRESGNPAGQRSHVDPRFRGGDPISARSSGACSELAKGTEGATQRISHRRATGRWAVDGRSNGCCHLTTGEW